MFTTLAWPAQATPAQPPSADPGFWDRFFTSAGFGGAMALVAASVAAVVAWRQFRATQRQQSSQRWWDTMIWVYDRRFVEKDDDARMPEGVALRTFHALFDVVPKDGSDPVRGETIDAVLELISPTEPKDVSLKKELRESLTKAGYGRSSFTAVLPAQEAIKTYRYLRIGIIAAIVLLATSIAIERSKVDCWQTSIGAYYYTPVRAIFVVTMIAVGLSLIVYKGRSNVEDVCLTFAGMLAWVVAVAPTTDVGSCWSVAPSPLPVNDDGSVADWVVANVDNSIYALLIAGGVGLGVAAIVAMVVNRSVRAPIEVGERGTRVSLAVTALVLLLGWWLIQNWEDFHTQAYLASTFMFVFLIGAIVAKAIGHWDERGKMWFWVYAAIAGLMVLGGILIPTTRVFGEHTVFALESYEFAFFAFFWIVQTVVNWDEKVIGAIPVNAEVG